MKKKLLLIVVLILIVGSIVYLELQKPKTSTTPTGAAISTPVTQTKGREKIIAEKEKKYAKAMELVDATGFINTDGIKVSDLVGKKVIMIDFWTYSCINCQHTTPYLNSWYDKYRDQGFEILGIHSPEFDFEKKYENVQRAVEKFGIKYPVILDSDMAIWRTYRNRYWPRKYLVDIDGYVVYDHIGEGGYDETEKKIQELLKERGEVLGTKENIPDDMVKPSDAPTFDASQSLSPETYFGYERNRILANGEIGKPGVQTFIAPTSPELNKLYLVGDWDITAQYAENVTPQAKIIYHYTGKNVYFVASAENDTRVSLMLDGKPLTETAGEDIGYLSSVQGGGVIKEDRLYKLVKGENYGDHTLEINIDQAGLHAFTFTFD